MAQTLTGNICLAELASDVTANCANPIIKGYEHVAYIINKADIASVTADKNVISAIELSPTKKAYKIQVRTRNPFNGSNVTMQDGDIPQYQKDVVMRIDNDGAEIAEIMRQLKDGEFVIILESKWDGTQGDAKFEVIGAESGAMATAQVRNRNEEGGGWNVTMSEKGCNSAGVYYLNTDATTSKADLEKLCQGGV